MLWYSQMGLGKTAQSIAVMAWLKQYGNVYGPFMVVAPLTTLGHWQREIQTWTGLVGCVVQVHGTSNLHHKCCLHLLEKQNTAHSHMPFDCMQPDCARIAGTLMSCIMQALT